MVSEGSGGPHVFESAVTGRYLAGGVVVDCVKVPGLAVGVVGH